MATHTLLGAEADARCGAGYSCPRFFGSYEH